jgi:hypothetical protein
VLAVPRIEAGSTQTRVSGELRPSPAVSRGRRRQNRPGALRALRSVTKGGD